VMRTCPLGSGDMIATVKQRACHMSRPCFDEISRPATGELAICTTR
jgi:hypothetical protein